MRTRADKSGAPSRAVLSILFALGDQELHGYGIMKEVEDRTGGRVSLLPSSLYATIKRMLEEGLVAEVEGVTDDGSPGKPKRTYRITDEGRHLAQREAERLAALLDLAQASTIGPSPAVSDSGA